MIHLSVEIEPENGDNILVSGISFMRRTDIKNELGEYKYTYGGWWSDRHGIKNYVDGAIYNKREENIFNFIEKICVDINKKFMEKI